MTFKKTKLCLAIAVTSVTMVAALVSPQVAAKAKAKRATTTSSRSSLTNADLANRKTEVLEAQVQAMQDEIARLNQLVTAPRADGTTEKVQELDQWMADQKAIEAKPKPKDNMVFFRGGYNLANGSRGGNNPNGNTSGLLVPSPGVNVSDPLAGGPFTHDDGWYFGAGFDFSLNDNLFGLVKNTEVLAELLVDYKQFNGKYTSVLTGQNLKVNQLTVAASPKIKFLKGKAFRPWLIPAGFEINVISPPSGAVTVLNPGIQFGVGADYKIWKDLYLGADARYHLAPGRLDGVNLNGFTTGGYLGIGF
jgi:hypothetical protein